MDSKEEVSFLDFTRDVKTLTTDGSWQTGNNSVEIRNMNQTLFVEAMASCTEITYVNGNLVGDPLDVKMFDSTGWSLVESAFDDQASNDQNIVLAYV